MSGYYDTLRLDLNPYALDAIGMVHDQERVRAAGIQVCLLRLAPALGNFEAELYIAWDGRRIFSERICVEALTVREAQQYRVNLLLHEAMDYAMARLRDPLRVLVEAIGYPKWWRYMLQDGHIVPAVLT